MRQTIHYNSTLDYCDGVQVFDARDAIGGHYVAVLTPEPAHGHGRYLVVGVAPADLLAFRLGQSDLRWLIENRKTDQWYLADVGECLMDAATLRPHDGPIPEAYLPAPGFSLMKPAPPSAIRSTGGPLTLVGRLREVDMDAGTWRLLSADSGQEYSGRIRPGVSLSRLVVDDEYWFVCEEEVQGAAGSGGELRTLYLTEFVQAA